MTLTTTLTWRHALKAMAWLLAAATAFCVLMCGKPFLCGPRAMHWTDGTKSDSIPPLKTGTRTLLGR